MMLDLYAAMDAGFSLSHKDNFKNYVDLHKMVSKWIILSDFCLGDKDKPNDAISYVFVPYVAQIEDLERLARKHLPQDFKNVKADKIGLDFLNSKLFFSVTIQLEKRIELLRATPDTSREQMYAALIRNSLTKIQGHPLAKKIRLMGLKRNFKLMDRIILTAFFAAFFSDLLMRSLEKVEKIGWFPDRDNMTTAYDEIIYDLIHKLFHEFNQKPAEGVLNFGKGVGEGKMWYDGLNRFPDYLVGTIADFDMTKQQCSGEKQKRILAEVFAVNDCHAILAFKNRCFSSIKLSKKA